MTSAGRPIHAPLLIRLRDVYGQRVDTVIGHIIPYRPGAYTYSFVLNDSRHPIGHH